MYNNMEFQQNSHQDQNIAHINSDGMEGKYMDFYANLEIAGSECSNSEADNLDIELHQFLEGNKGNCDCIDHQPMQNPGVAEIPTIYLITRIRTEQLPERKQWRDVSIEKSKKELSKFGSSTLEITYVHNRECALKNCTEFHKKCLPQRMSSKSYFFLNENFILDDKAIKRVQFNPHVTERLWKTDSALKIHDKYQQQKKKQSKRSLHPRQNNCQRKNCKLEKQNGYHQHNSIRKAPQVVQQNLLKIIQAYEINNYATILSCKHSQSQKGMTRGWRTIHDKPKKQFEQLSNRQLCRSNDQAKQTGKKQGCSIGKNKRPRPQDFIVQKRKDKYRFNKNGINF